MRETNNDKRSVVAKMCRLTPDLIFGGLQLSRKNAAVLRQLGGLDA